MFSKKIFFSIFLTTISLPAFGLLEDSTCLKEMEEYYPLLKTGEIHWKKQARFFRCVHDSLELIVKHKIFTHDSSRDYFTRSEIFKMFHVYFKMDKKLAEDVASNFFLIKHLLVGGKLNQLSDQELEDIYLLVYTYKDFYYIIFKQLKTINKILDVNKRHEVSDREFQFTIKRLAQGLDFLKESYQNMQISYQVSDFDNLLEYLKVYTDNDANKNQNFQFLKIWLQGLLAPKTEIQGKSWKYFFDSFQDILAMFLQYKRYIYQNDLAQPITFYRTLQGFRYFVSSLSHVQVDSIKKGFPIKSIDSMLEAILLLSDNQAGFLSKVLSQFKQDQTQSISLLTRNLICFSLEAKKRATCSYKTHGKNSLSIEYQFPDGIFQFYSTHQKWLPKQGARFDITPNELRMLQKWLNEYIRSYDRLLKGHKNSIYKKYHISQWLHFFNQSEKDNRLIFYDFSKRKQATRLPYQFLNYRFLSDLFLMNYKNQDGYKLSLEDWKRIVDEIFPALLALNSQGYEINNRKQLKNLFDYADHFINSSNHDQFLNDGEMLDLIIHLMSAMKNSQYAYKKLNQLCSSLEISCLETQFFNSDIMRPFPKLVNYLSHSDSNAHLLKTRDLLKNRTVSSELDLLDLFLIIQALEVQFESLDKNKNNRLEHYEIQDFVQGLSKEIVFTIPYLRNHTQATAFIMYSLKTGALPFLDEKDQNFHSLQFYYWYINNPNEPFGISKGDLYSVIMDFYQLSRRYQ